MKNLVELKKEELREIKGGNISLIFDICNGSYIPCWWNSETGECHSVIGNECN